MARILMTWELGSHLGHLTRLSSLADELHRRGHHISFALRELHAVESVFGIDTPYDVYQAPIFLPTIKGSRNPLSYSEILQCNGYLSSQSLRYLVKAWQALTDAVSPDLIIYNYSPTAMLANRKLRKPKIEVGTGFFIPPKMSPMPQISSEKKLSLGQRQVTDDQVISVINQVLANLNTDPIKHIHELFDGALQLLTSFPEMDCFQQRQNGNYVGPMSAPSKGRPANWKKIKQSSSASRIFVYLQASYTQLKELMSTLSQTHAEIRAYIPNCSAEFTAEFESDKVQISVEPYAMDEILSVVDLAICHAGHDTVVNSLLAGTPLLLVPQYVEQLEVARCIENINAGIILYPNEAFDNIQKKVTRLCTDKRYRDSANRFSERYRHTTVEQCISAVSDQCELAIKKHKHH